jgi:hypothetical protein
MDCIFNKSEMRKILLSLILGLFFAGASAQDSLARKAILEHMKLFRKCKKDMYRRLESDSVYFFGTCQTATDYNYVDFYKLVKTKEQRHNWIIYQFYFIKDNLNFIVQGTRNRKYFSEYYLNQGQVFSTDLSDKLPLLTQESINLLKQRLLEIRNSGVSK